MNYIGARKHHALRESVARVRRYAAMSIHGEEGSFDVSTDPTVAASTLFVVLNATPTWFREPGRLSYAELTDWYTDLFLKGMRAPS